MASVLCPSCNVYIDFWIDKCTGWPREWFADKALQEHMAEKHD